ncbi:DUF2071 domain-containing protein [Apibacter raozihei]|uniref:YqjF family protein n=1 Tax=Apibacter raozihei TaxID=2500547 RepID=UPI000FE324B5|nr:DUF2071 domain-containing protein [Apibacter raozihei]
MSFLTAEWRKLIMANYIIPKELVTPYLPKGTEIDTWNNNCYVSLVGFMFLNTKVLGIKIPYHINFEEVNLRFYVKRKEDNSIKRGVVFIKEIVPKAAITLVANNLYKENYETQKMNHQWDISDKLNISYQWKAKKEWQSMEVTALNTPQIMEKNSEAEFIAEHYWGYAEINKNKTMEYEVTHPRWKTYPIENYSIQVDFTKVYGNEFALLNSIQPASVFLIEGSEITIEKNKITS